MIGRFRKKTPLESPSRPVEIWSHFTKAHRFFKFVTAGSLVLAGLGLAGGAYGFLYAIHEPLVFVVDSEGDARFAGRRGSTSEPSEAEIRYVARRFLEKTLAFHSATIESDLADAMNLMTEELREKMQREFAGYAQDKGQSFVAWVKEQNVRAVFEPGRMTVSSHGDATWSIEARGRVTTWPENEVVREADGLARDVEAKLTLRRVMRTETTPHGVLVSASATRFFKLPVAAEALENKVRSTKEEPR